MEMGYEYKIKAGFQRWYNKKNVSHLINNFILIAQ